MKTTNSLRWWPVTKKGLGQLARRDTGKNYHVTVLDDLFAPGVPYHVIDFVLAVVASRGSWTFELTTSYPNRQSCYLASLGRRSKGAAKKYEHRVRAHFHRYKTKFREGYSLPSPPTPELRAIYDSAAKHERRDLEPCDRTLRTGFSLGVYHWREWPLTNLIIHEATKVK